MKKYALFILVAATALFSSCWEQSDPILSYGQFDRQVFEDAEKSFEAQFNALWTALNCNYGIWDYEKEHGLDWDAVLAEYLPRFKELDARDNVTDEEFKAIYSEIINPLHDGHLMVQVKNLKTGSFLMFQPSMARMTENRKEAMEQSMALQVDLSAYEAMTSGPMQITDSKVPQFSLRRMLGYSMRVTEEYIKPHLGLCPPAEDAPVTDQLIYKYCMSFMNDFNQYYQIVMTGNFEASATFANEMAEKYSMLGDLLGFSLPLLEPSMVGRDPGIEYHLFGGSIPYLRISDFMLTPWLNDERYAQMASGRYPTTEEFKQEVKATWQAWIDAIASLKAAGQLKGVIIDLRNNNGGIMQDFQYVLGALIPSGGYSFYKVRTKQGIGRYDYAPAMDFMYKTLETPHTVVDTEPIVLLCNARSISMAEMSSAGVKSLPNGCLIGTRTWGALSSLSSEESSYSQLYASTVGRQNVTSFYAYIPCLITVFPEEGILEGVGITPNIEIDLDVALLNTEHRDNQLERAIEYIVTGK